MPLHRRLLPLLLVGIVLVSRFEDAAGVSSTAIESKAEGKPSKQRSFSKLGASDASIDFPLLIPPYGRQGVDPDPSKYGSCMLYMESLQVVVVNAKTKEAGVAVIGVDSVTGLPNAKYGFDSSSDEFKCLPNVTAGGTADKNSGKFWLTLNINPNDEVKALPPSNGDGKTSTSSPLFTVQGPIVLKLEFQIQPNSYWNLTNVVAGTLNVGKGTLLPTDVQVQSLDPKAFEIRQDGFSSYYDYSYACASTPISTWEVDKDKRIAVGVVFGNIQFQPFGVLFGKDEQGTSTVAFTSRVNDCVGNFSIGSWMGIVVALILGMVLIAGFLMLNSVQTMDRFDDPRQKQIVINTHE